MSMELKIVALAEDIPAEGLVVGDVGTVVHEYSDGLAFEVEFVNFDGQTVAVATVERSKVRPVGGTEILRSRPPLRKKVVTG